MFRSPLLLAIIALRPGFGGDSEEPRADKRFPPLHPKARGLLDEAVRVWIGRQQEGDTNHRLAVGLVRDACAHSSAPDIRLALYLRGEEGAALYRAYDLAFPEGEA